MFGKWSTIYQFKQNQFLAMEDVTDRETAGVKKPGDDDQLIRIDQGKGEQNSRLNNNLEDLLELIMTADELQKPEEFPIGSSMQQFSTKQSQAATENHTTSN